MVEAFANQEVVRATVRNKVEVIELLTEFRKICFEILCPWEEIRHVPREESERLFDQVINSEDIGIFLWRENGEFSWICVAQLMTKIQTWKYVQLNDVYVKKESQWNWLAQQLIQETEKWSRDAWALFMQLNSWIELQRAHTFYKKYWFKEFWSAFQINFR